MSDDPALYTIDVGTNPYMDQRPGTSGVRRRVAVFQQDNYVENFIQAILNAIPRLKLVIVGGDGRYYCKEALYQVLNVLIANDIQRIIVALDGIMSTPSASDLIIRLGADCAFILTASHNHGGPNGDFGIKFNFSNGGPAPESITEKIYDRATKIRKYRSLVRKPNFRIDVLRRFNVHHSCITIIDPIQKYLETLRKIFDFPKIKELLTLGLYNDSTRPFKILANPMNGVLSSYLWKILVHEFNLNPSCLMHAQLMEDFGGLIPDPNLTHCHDMVVKMIRDPDIDFGVAFDGDGDRNMVLGAQGFYVSPGDALAVIGDNLDKVMYFQTNMNIGFARSFPTAPAIDRVAEVRRKTIFEVPTGWKYFGNLLDGRLISLCGEESFGLGAETMREKDGMFAMFAWLSIIAHTKLSVRQLLERHWDVYGRDYFVRYDYEGVMRHQCEELIEMLEAKFASRQLVNTKYNINGKEYTIVGTGNFQYADPVDNTVTTKQGLFINFANGARIIYRSSGTSSVGGTLRMYVSDYSATETKHHPQTYLKPLIDVGLEIGEIPARLERSKPTVIT